MKTLQAILFTLLSLATAQTLQAAEQPWQTSYDQEAKGHYAQAAAPLLALVEQGEQHEFLWIRLGWLSYLQGNYNDAKHYYGQAASQNSNSIDARLGLFKPLAAQKRWREADKYMEQALAISPKHLQVNLNKMMIEAQQKDWISLVKRAKQLTQHYPTNVDILVYLARANSWLGNVDAAQSAYRQVLKLHPSNIEARYFLKQSQ